MFPGTPILAFVDASGNTDLDTEKEGATAFFILTAVLVPGDCAQKLRAEADGVRARHFGRGEMKSSLVRGDDKRRYKVIADIADLDFQFITLIVDKRRLSHESGLAHKGSFISSGLDPVRWTVGLRHHRLLRRVSSNSLRCSSGGEPDPVIGPCSTPSSFVTNSGQFPASAELMLPVSRCFRDS